MIIKHFNLKPNLDEENKLILFYGNNEGLKSEEIFKITKNIEVFTYDEKEILEKKDNFFETVLSGSLFDDKRIFLIKRASDKIFKIIEELNEKNLNNTSIIIDAGILEKKSKLRNLFEKDKELICTPFYADTLETLSKLAQSILRNEKILISPSDINFIVSKSSGDRMFLKNELNKIILYSHSKKKLTVKDLKKLINLTENYSITELVDNCLIKNMKKTIKILNENNFSNDDCILITRTILNKSKKILKLSQEYQKNKNIDLTISTAKPPIFWKDKEIIKQQIYKWSPKNIKNFIYKLNDLELIMKKNYNNSIILITDFILTHSSPDTSN